MKKIIIYIAQGTIKLLSKLVDKLNGQENLQTLLKSNPPKEDGVAAPVRFVRPPAKFGDTFCRANEEIVETNRGITIHIPRISSPSNTKVITD